MYVYVHMCPGAPECQKGAWDDLELKSQGLWAARPECCTQVYLQEQSVLSTSKLSPQTPENDSWDLE